MDFRVHIPTMPSNQGVRYRVEDVVLDAQAMARRGTKIGEEASSAFLLMSFFKVGMLPFAAKVLLVAFEGA